jgi:hypothetical protein
MTNKDIYCQRFILDDQHYWSDARFDKDRFIELAQQALEQVDMEEEQTSVFQELFEAFIAQTSVLQVATILSKKFNIQHSYSEQQNTHKQSMEYLWKLFRLLFLASVVCLVIHYFTW